MTDSSLQNAMPTVSKHDFGGGELEQIWQHWISVSREHKLREHGMYEHYFPASATAKHILRSSSSHHSVRLIQRSFILDDTTDHGIRISRTVCYIPRQLRLYRLPVRNRKTG